MALPRISKIRRFLNHAPVWQTIPAVAISVCLGRLITSAIIYRLNSGGWDMDWATKFVDSLGTGVVFSLLWAWLIRTGVSNSEQDGQQRS
jgi:hypothetical protein